jgi:ribonucleotide reductase alpha subunit
MESFTQNSVVTHLDTLEKPVWGPMGEVVYERTYSRIKANGEKETWAETVDRVTSTISDPDERKRVAELIYSFEMIPAGRHLWVTGTGLPYVRNCFRAPFTSRLADHFEFMGSQLMTGGGVGANYSQEYLTLSDPIREMGNIYITIDRSHRDYNDVKLQSGESWLEPEDFLDRVNDLYYNHGAVALNRISDDREGWVESWGLLFDHATGINSKLDLYFDLTEIRSRGEVIKTFGGTASGPDPLAGSLVKVHEVLKRATGRHLSSVEAMECDHYLAEAIVAGGARRSARMSIVHWDDPHIFDFIHCKENPMLHWSTNISVEVDDSFFEALTRHEEGALAVARAVVTGMVHNGEPGFYNSSYASFGEHSDTRSTNPCFSGDTLVMTADGRDAVSLEQLAKEGLDVPVYSTDEFGNVSIKMGRNPRVTGYNQKLLRIHTDKDFYVDVTPNHKMMTRDGQIVEAKDLQIGQSLMPFTKRQEKFSSDGQPYWRVYTNALTEKEGKIMEHRLISKFNDSNGWESAKIRTEECGGCANTGGIVVHHKDFNGLNNSPDNLAVMTWREHQLLHAQLADVSGEKNPRYSGFADDDIRNRAIELTKELGRRFSHKEWVNDTNVSNMPRSFSAHRSELGSVVELSHWAAEKLGFITHSIDTRTLRLLQIAEQQGYEAQLVDKTVYVNRVCETCQHDFLVNYQQREQAFCSVACGNKHLENDPKRKATAAKYWSDKMAETKLAQTKVYCDLKHNLGRDPQKPEWIDACRTQKISYRLNPKSPNAFPNWKAVQEAGDNHNHKVIRIEELDGEHTVYNLTVDENHTLCVGKLVGNRYSGINALQCGEINLQEGESCNIGSVNLAAFGTDDDGAKEAFELMARYLVRATLTVPDHNLTAMVEAKNRRIGVGFFGFQEWAAAHGVKYSEIPHSEILAEKLESFRRTVRLAADRYADELGIPRPIKVTAIAPNGTISILPGVQAGIHPVLAKYFKRRVRFTNGDKLIDKAIEEGRHTEPCIYSQNTTVVENIVRDQILDSYDESLIQESHEVTLDEQLAVLQFVTHHFTNGNDGNAVSFTANIQPEELTDFEHVYEVIMGRLPHVKGMTIFPVMTRPQSPIEAITAKEYHDYHGTVEEHGSSLDENCSTGACPIR